MGAKVSAEYAKERECLLCVLCEDIADFAFVFACEGAAESVGNDTEKGNCRSLRFG
jgi:hypothetical protein